MSLFRSLISLILIAELAACSGAPKRPDGAPGSLKIGKPYTINGETYYPEYDPHYSEEGIASWYGPGFHGKKTANGEDYDMHALTAAHKTLPMPSLVRVTNLQNGKTVVVKITDRGPFKAGRIIDLSKAAAEAVDIKGVGKVHVEYLKNDTEQMWADMNITPKNIQFARNDKAAPSKTEIMQAQTEYDRAQQVAFYDESNVTDAAPIMSVSSNDVGGVTQSNNKAQSAGFGLISDAQADTTQKPLAPLPANPSNKTYTSVQRSDDDKNYDLNIAENEVTIDTSSEGGNPRTVASEKISTYPNQDQTKAIAMSEPRSLDPPDSSAATTDGYYVQAGAFSNASNADSLASRIRHLGKAAVETIARANGALHRVRLGPYASKSEAEGILHKLFELGIKDASVVSSKS